MVIQKRFGLGLYTGSPPGKGSPPRGWYRTAAQGYPGPVTGIPGGFTHKDLALAVRYPLHIFLLYILFLNPGCLPGWLCFNLRTVLLFPSKSEETLPTPHCVLVPSLQLNDRRSLVHSLIIDSISRFIVSALFMPSSNPHRAYRISRHCRFPSTVYRN